MLALLVRGFGASFVTNVGCNCDLNVEFNDRLCKWAAIVVGQGIVGFNNGLCKGIAIVVGQRILGFNGGL